MAEKQDFKTKVKGAFGTKAFKSGGYSLLASVIEIGRASCRERV